MKILKYLALPFVFLGYKLIEIGQVLTSEKLWGLVVVMVAGITIPCVLGLIGFYVLPDGLIWGSILRGTTSEGLFNFFPDIPGLVAVGSCMACISGVVWFVTWAFYKMFFIWFPDNYRKSKAKLGL